ncbi:MAG TPA: glycine--tRNA ligase [Candidatus Hodarchaeales archaeon]|nr:glycine--tRNA ligase [Candidatus Hodarchaeales archaeon]
MAKKIKETHSTDSTSSLQAMDKIIALAKNRGFIFAGSEIYGGLANSWDLGPLGTELKRNIKDLWWKMFVESRPDVVGLDANIIMSTKAWEASGHLKNFNDELVECRSCHERQRGDELEADKKKKLDDIACPKCGNKDWTKPAMFNTMFKTNLGPVESPENTVYLRPETAQAMFVDFPEIVRVARKKLPFGIAQIGKAFRNEITPGNFIFRLREFEQMEIEYFIEPPKTKKDWEKYFDGWLKEIHTYLETLGVDMKRVKDTEVAKEDRAHYSERTVDIEFVYPFGQKELYGLAYRGDYDLKAHGLKYKDPESGKEFIPHVIEPSFGVERTMLAVLLSAYTEEEAPTADGNTNTRVVMKFPKEIAPVKVAILPLSNDPKLVRLAKEEVWKFLIPWFATEYDDTQSIGKRYRRQDEIGTPYCVTVDFESLEDKKVTVRDRDTMKQDRVEISKLEGYLAGKLK